MNRLQTTFRATTAGVLAALVVGAIVPGVVAAATRPVKFDVVMGYSCISGRASDGATVELVWRQTDGTRKARASVPASASGGYWSYCSNDGDVVAIGDSFFAHDGASSHAFVVPELTLVINRVDDVFKGVAPAGDYVRLICGYTNGFEPCQRTWSLRVNPEGRWKFRPQWPVAGWQGMSVRWRSDDGDAVTVNARGPYVDVTIGSATVRGAARANGPVTVVLRRAGSFDVAGTAVTTAGAYVGEFRTKFRDSNGNPVKVRVGDWITSDISPDVDFTVPNVVASADASTDLVTGQCPDYSMFVEAVVMRSGYEDGDWDWPEEGGSFELDLSWPDLQAGESVRAHCYRADPGDWVGRLIVAQ
ncbi:MAG TPA: hypothetical protein VMZ33_04590 [Candidatus Limnocylindrales bacterium]|nr:hypothetical protein [Candidatus Limnocylindrales bacterium]